MDLRITKDLVSHLCSASHNVGLPSEKAMSPFIVPFSRHAVSLIISPSLRRRSSRQLSNSSPIHRNLSENVRSMKRVSSWLCKSRQRTIILGVAVSLTLTDLHTQNGKSWFQEAYSSLKKAQPKAYNCGRPYTANYQSTAATTLQFTNTTKHYSFPIFLETFRTSPRVSVKYIDNGQELSVEKLA